MTDLEFASEAFSLLSQDELEEISSRAASYRDAAVSPSWTVVFDVIEVIATRALLERSTS